MNTPAILQQLNGASLTPNLQPIKNMMQMIRGAQNPQAMMNMLVQNNPNLHQAMDLIQQSGGDPQKAFYTLCNQRGIDPQQILNAMK